MSGQTTLVELIGKIIPFLRKEKYDYKVAEEICKLCLPYLSIKETTLFSYVVLSIFDELRIYIEDVVDELGKMFGIAAQNGEEERISNYLQEDFITHLQTLKEQPQDSKELHRILSDMIHKWLTFEKEDFSRYK
ncbi:hypothetical protein C5S29_10380 [ANME-1 cluster archaeon GoMg3.2]|jgi:hypothetical protein|nr:hypothetical protein [ANME-1 cluster archaeon GoMg3.2]